MLYFLLYTTAFFILSVAYFALVQKPFFGLYNKAVMREKLSLSSIGQTYAHGVVSDFIIASYLTAIPMLVTGFHTLFPFFNLHVVLSVINAIIALIVALITVSDTLLYRFWNYKLDASAFVYLRSLKGTFASVSGKYIAGALVLTIIAWAFFFFPAELLADAYTSHFGNITLSSPWHYFCVVLLMLLAAGIFFLIIRGLKIRPNNPSVVYFSNIPFLNHWALNPAYNLIYSLGTKDEFKGKFRFFDDEECENINSHLFPDKGKPMKKLLTTDRPNILLIIWESLGAEFIGSLGGNGNVAVNFDRIASEEGVLFTKCTAGSFRTDRGLVCLLSGYPGQPTTSVIRYTRKLPNLPALPRRLKEVGYTTTAIHGGDLTIMHKSDYYLASGHDKLISQKDFPSSAPTCKWGVHDGYIFDYIYDDIVRKNARGEKWFITFQTLSSHEPFTVPYNRISSDKIANAFAYTDSCFGDFIDRLKQTKAWDDTLIICVADHGYNATSNPPSRQDYAHIPVLLTGGAIAEHGKIDLIMSQTDLAATLLGQMGLDHSEFIFSRDILADTYTEPFSFHTFNNGFMFTDPTGSTIVDNVSGLATEGSDPEREKKGRAILQKLYHDLSLR